MGVKIDTNKLDLNEVSLVNKSKQVVGELRSAAFFSKIQKIVGIAMVNINLTRDNKKISIKINNKNINGEICNFPII